VCVVCSGIATAANKDQYVADASEAVVRNGHWKAPTELWKRVTQQTRRRALLRASIAFAMAVVWLPTAQQAKPTRFAGALYLHSGSSDFIDTIRPTGRSPKFKDSPLLDSSGFQAIGIWTAAPVAGKTELVDLGDFTGWIGLVEPSDRGMSFDIRVEILKNTHVIAFATRG
jgi:hypothetical protein